MQRLRTIRRRRSLGIAEIECMLCILILLLVLFLTIGVSNLGNTRITTVAEAEFKALGNAGAGSPNKVPEYTDDPALTEVTTEWDIRPGLPNRTHVARVDKEVSIFKGDDAVVTDPKMIHGVAGAITSPWMIHGYPFETTDAGTMQSWFDQFIVESHAELAPPLMLAPDWKP